MRGKIFLVGLLAVACLYTDGCKISFGEGGVKFTMPNDDIRTRKTNVPNRENNGNTEPLADNSRFTDEAVPEAQKDETNSELGKVQRWIIALNYAKINSEEPPPWPYHLAGSKRFPPNTYQRSIGVFTAQTKQAGDFAFREKSYQEKPPSLVSLPHFFYKWICASHTAFGEKNNWCELNFEEKCRKMYNGELCCFVLNIPDFAQDRDSRFFASR